MSILSLPFELLKCIFAYNKQHELPVLSQVCKKFYEIIGKKSFIVSEDLAMQSPELLVWSMANGYRISYGIIPQAVIRGNVELVKFIFTKKSSYLRIEKQSDLCELAVKGGQMRMLRALRDGSLGKVFPWSWLSCHYAIGLNRIDILRALRDGSLGEKCPRDQHSILTAVQMNNSEAIKLFRVEGLEWYPSKEECVHFAKTLGHLELAKEIESGNLD